MDRFGTLKLFTAVSLLGGVCHCLEAVVQGPVSAIKGSCVFVPCSTVPYSAVKWYKYKRVGYPVVYSRDRTEIMDEFSGRTSIPGSAQEGNCTLRINNVKQQDGEVDLYVWIWKHDGDHKGFYDKTIKINVLDPVAPEISVKSTQIEGKDFTATCKCHYSCPSSPPQMAWLGLSAITNVLTHKKVENGLWLTEDTATFRVTRRNQNTLLGCRCVSSERSLSSNSVSLDVLYAPTDVKVDYAGSSTVIESNEISLECTCKSRPAPTQYEWLVIKNGTSTRPKGRTVVLQDVMRDTSVSCVATNDIGRGESKQISLDVHYAPTDVKVDYTGSSTVIESNEISLECTCKSRPAPTQYEWLVIKNGTSTRPKGRTVVLQDVMRDTSVSCVATNDIGRGESKQISLDVHHSPSFLPGSFCSSWNGTLQCECQAKAKPSPLISWTIDGSGALFPPFNTKTQNNGSVTVSELTGPPGHNVTCTATNSVGTKFIQIPVHSEGNAPAVQAAGVAGVAVVAVVVGVCVIIGLAVTAIRFWKKRRRAEPCEDLSTALHMSPDKKCHEYGIESDENLYVNTEHCRQAYEHQDAESCVYENFDKRS